MSQERIWVSPAQFERLEGEKLFHWKSGITFVQLFDADTGNSLGLPNFLPPISRLRTIEFDVIWTATVASDGRFMHLSVEEIKPTKHEFVEPMDSVLENYEITRSGAQ